MLEYASIRLMFCCRSPIALPNTIVATAIPTTAGCHALNAAGNASSQDLKNAAKAAVLTVAAMYAVTGDGAPS